MPSASGASWSPHIAFLPDLRTGFDGPAAKVDAALDSPALTYPLLVLKTVHQSADSHANSNDKYGREHDRLFALAVRTVERMDRLQCPF